MRPKRQVPIRLQVLRISLWSKAANFKVIYDGDPSMVQRETLAELYSGVATGMLTDAKEKIAVYLVSNYGDVIGSDCPDPRVFITPDSLRLKETTNGSRIASFQFTTPLDPKGFAILVKNARIIQMGNWDIFPEH